MYLKLLGFNIQGIGMKPAKLSFLDLASINY